MYMCICVYTSFVSLSFLSAIDKLPMSEIETPVLAPVSVVYCGVCSYPTEYCEFGKSFKKCKKWLEDHDSAEYSRLYSESSKKESSIGSEREEKIAKDLEKMQLKEERKQERELANIKNSKILIKRIPRTKHKNIISIANLEVLDVDIKKLAKTFASKFATGSSVTKNAEKKDEIVIQGDVGEEVEEYLNNLLKEKNLSEIKVEIVEEKKMSKKKPVIN